MEMRKRIAEKSPIACNSPRGRELGRSNLDEGCDAKSIVCALLSTEDKDEGVSAFLEKRKAAFKGR